jgi:hypothetical protein
MSRCAHALQCGLDIGIGRVDEKRNVVRGGDQLVQRCSRFAASLHGQGNHSREVLLLFVIIATLSSHRYWEFTEVAARRAQDNNFYKNLAIMGGLVFAFVTAGGRFSIDRLLVRQ